MSHRNVTSISSSLEWAGSGTIQSEVVEAGSIHSFRKRYDKTLEAFCLNFWVNYSGHDIVIYFSRSIGACWHIHILPPYAIPLYLWVDQQTVLCQYAALSFVAKYHCHIYSLASSSLLCLLISFTTCMGTFHTSPCREPVCMSSQVSFPWSYAMRSLACTKCRQLLRQRLL